MMRKGSTRYRGNLCRLTDIEGFSHLIVIWEFDRSEGFNLVGKPPSDDRTHGVFATRSPRRPNPIWLTVVEMFGRERPNRVPE